MPQLLESPHEKATTPERTIFDVDTQSLRDALWHVLTDSNETAPYSDAADDAAVVIATVAGSREETGWREVRHILKQWGFWRVTRVKDVLQCIENQP